MKQTVHPVAVGLVLASALAIASWGGGLGCKSSPNPTPSKEEPPGAPQVDHRADLEEDELGVWGGPVDDTEFEFEPTPDDPPPLETHGVPEVPSSLKDSMAAFLSTGRARLQSISADAQSIIYITRAKQSAQAFRLGGPKLQPEQLTDGPDPVVQFAREPQKAARYMFRVDRGGNEDYQILRSRRGEIQSITDGRSRHGRFAWSPRGKQAAFTGNRRDPAHMDVYRVFEDPTRPAELFLKRDGSWAVGSWSPDGQRFLIREYLAHNRSGYHLVDVDERSTTPLGSPSSETRQTRARFLNDDVILTVTNRGGNYLHLFRVDLRSGDWVDFTPDLSWDVDELAVHSTSGRVAYATNEHGLSRLWILDTAGEEVASGIPIPDGIVSELKFARNGEALAFTFDRPTDTGDVFVLDIGSHEMTRWTHSLPDTLDTRRFETPHLVHVESFDGLEVPAWVYTPKGKGPHPVLLWIHGGPEEQYQPTFNPIIQFLVTKLGIGVIAPNVRGSTGYGRSYVGLDDTWKREDAIRDVGAILDWIRDADSFDEDRVGIFGASYGGYVVLASMIHYSERLRAGCDMVGIANFVTFLEETRSYRRDQRRVEYGDERDPKMRTFLQRISPTARADEIRSPLFIAHGANDPRVPLREARQIFEAVQDAGSDAWLMVAHDEGHGFKQRRNRDAFYQAMVHFFDIHLSEANVPRDATTETDAAAGVPSNEEE